MTLRELIPELAKVAKDELGEVPSRIEEDLKAIKEWLAKQPHIKARTDDQWLIAFLRGCKFSIERTKEKLDNYYLAKTMVPEMMRAEDPTKKEFQDFVRLGSAFPLLKPVGVDGPSVMVIRPGAYNSSKYTVENNVRLINMITTILMLEDDNTIICGQRYILDLKNVDMGHFVQMTPVTIKKMVSSNEGALPIRQKGTHHINTPSGVETIFSLFQSFMSEKNRQRILLHNENYEEMYKYIPKETLPTEYGGEAGSIAEISEHWVKKLESYKDHFLEDNQFKTDESKRLGKPKNTEAMFGIEGTFRKLTVD